MVFDGHSDLLYDVTRRRKAGETCVLERRHRRDLCAGGVEGLSLALWVRPEPNETFRDATEKMVAYARAEFRESPWLQVVRTRAEAEPSEQIKKRVDAARQIQNARFEAKCSNFPRQYGL